jgi:hypothetical protein
MRAKILMAILLLSVIPILDSVSGDLIGKM